MDYMFQDEFGIYTEWFNTIFAAHRYAKHCHVALIGIG